MAVYPDMTTAPGQHSRRLSGDLTLEQRHRFRARCACAQIVAYVFARALDIDQAKAPF